MTKRTKAASGRIAGGAVIIDDGSPLHPAPGLNRVARGRVRGAPMMLFSTVFKVDGLKGGVFPSHRLTGLKTEVVVLTYGRFQLTFPWDDVKSFEVEAADDQIDGHLKPGELKLDARFKLRKDDPNVNLYLADTGPIFRVQVKFAKGGKVEIQDQETQVLRLDLFFTK